MQLTEENAQAKRRQTESAVQLARESRWDEAVTANRAILKQFPNDIDAHNRLGKALMELGRYNDAKRSYRKALSLDPTNQIARKNLERLAVLAKTGAAQAETAHADPSLFIEEMGKSAVTTLENPELDVLARINAGDPVELKSSRKGLVVQTSGGDLVGAVEPKLRSRLVKLLEGGNKYAAAVTSVSNDQVRIIIKETYQDPSLAGRPSFPTGVTAERTRPYTKGRLIRRETTEENDFAAAADGDDEEWDDDHVGQEGNVPLNAAAAAEDVDDEDDE